MDLSDVTLATEDNDQRGDHKVILAASSPFFKGLLHKNPNIHPLLSKAGRWAYARTKLLQIGMEWRETTGDETEDSVRRS